MAWRFLSRQAIIGRFLYFLIAMSNLNIITLLSQTSLAVQIVVGFLVVLALVSWYLIFRVGGRIGGIQRFDDEFETWLWGGESLQTQYQMVSNDFHRVGLEQIFYIGYDEFMTVQKITNNHAYVLQVTERKFNIILTKQKLILKEGLSTLSNISTVAPYLGLLGAIWGMVGAFSLSETITFAMLIPDIVEALLIIALGLFTAISTKWAVNYFNAQIEDIHENRALFCEELISVFAHQHMIAQKALIAQNQLPTPIAPSPQATQVAQVDTDPLGATAPIAHMPNASVIEAPTTQDHTPEPKPAPTKTPTPQPSSTELELESLLELDFESITEEPKTPQSHNLIK